MLNPHTPSLHLWIYEKYKDSFFHEHRVMSDTTYTWYRDRHRGDM